MIQLYIRSRAYPYWNQSHLDEKAPIEASTREKAKDFDYCSSSCGRNPLSDGASEERWGPPLLGHFIWMVKQADRYLTCLRRELTGIAGAPHLSRLYLPLFKICGDPAL